MKLKIKKEIQQYASEIFFCNTSFEGIKNMFKDIQQKEAQSIFDDIKKKGKYKVDKKQYGQNMMITLGEKRWKGLKKKHGVK